MRYIDELPDGARVQLLEKREAAMHGAAAAQAHLTVLGGSYWGADPADLFDALAVGIGRGCRGEDAARRTAALMALFGEAEVPEVVRLCGDVFEEIESQAAWRLSRIMDRLPKGRGSDADIAWLVGRAESLSDEMVLDCLPFDGDEDTSVELWRKVVRGRKPWTCHYSRRPIRIGERHLVICETRDGVMLETRHSLLAVYLMLEGHDPTLPASFPPVETRRAA